MYICKNPSGFFVMGDDKQDIATAGSHKILYNQATETILILDNSINQTPDWSKSISPTTIKKYDGTYYRNYTDLISAVPGLFSDKKDIYHVVLNQSGTNDPTVLVFESTIGVIVVTRSEVGTTLFTKAGAFPQGKCSPASAVVGYTAAGDKLVLTPVSDDVYKLETYAAVDTEVLADGVLVNQEIIIEIYKI